MIFRQTLRDGAIAMLKAANTLAGDQVSKEQAVPSPEAGDNFGIGAFAVTTC